MRVVISMRPQKMQNETRTKISSRSRFASVFCARFSRTEGILEIAARQSFGVAQAAPFAKTQAALRTYRAQHSCLALPAAPLAVLCSALEAAYRDAAAATGFRRLLQPPSSCAA